MEIKALVAQKGKIEFNKDEIEKALELIEIKYNGLTFTDEQVVEAKEERAKLNKLEKDLSTYRKNIVKEVTEPIKEFEDFMKSAEKRTKTISNNIDVQVKNFEAAEKEKRIEVVKKYLNEKFAAIPRYKEFENMFVLEDSIYTNKGSFTKNGEVGTKLIDHIDGIISQIDEILIGREAAEELLNQKRKLVVETCKSTSELLGLEIHLDPKNFAYLKDYELTEITKIINEAGKRAKEQQEAAIKRLHEEATRKAQEVLDKKETVPEPVKEEIKQENVNILETQKEEKLFYAEFSIDGIPVSLAKELSAWLKQNNVKYTVKTQEVK